MNDMPLTADQLRSRLLEEDVWLSILLGEELLAALRALSTMPAPALEVEP